MTIIDRSGVLERLGQLPVVALELGCGMRKRQPGTIGIDRLDYPSVDIVGEVEDVLRCFAAASVDSVSSWHFMEHVGDVQRLLEELARILKPGGSVTTVVPHFSNPYFYSDPTHRSTFGLYTFCYYAESRIFRRTIPNYGFVKPFNLESVDLVFKSFPPNYIRHALKKGVESIVNSCNWAKEFYEENLVWIMPCYELRYVMTKSAPFVPPNASFAIKK